MGCERKIKLFPTDQPTVCFLRAIRNIRIFFVALSDVRAAKPHTNVQSQHSLCCFHAQRKLVLKLLTPPPPPRFWGAEEKGNLFSWSWGALAIILGDLGSKHVLLEFWGALPPTKRGKQFQGFVEISALFLGIKGARGAS